MEPPNQAPTKPVLIKVPPGQKELDLSGFSKVLVLYTDKDRKKGLWFPISFITGEVLPKTLAVVPVEALKDVDYPHNQITRNQILISDSPLNRAEILSLPGNSDHFYQKVELRLMTLDKLGQLNKKNADLILVEVYLHVILSSREYQKLTTKSRPNGVVWNEAYQPKDLSLDELDQKITTRLAAEFKKMQYDLYSPLNLDEAKFSSFLNIFNLLTNFYREEIARLTKERQKLATTTRSDLVLLIREELPQLETYWRMKEEKESKELIQGILKNPLTFQLNRLFLRFDEADIPNSLQTQLKKRVGHHFEHDHRLRDKIERIIYKFSRTRYPELTSKREVTANRITLWNLLYQALKSPDLCGLMKHLNQIKDSEILSSCYQAAGGNEGVLGSLILRSLKLLAREETRQILDTSVEIDGNEAYVFSADNPIVWSQFPINRLITPTLELWNQQETKVTVSHSRSASPVRHSKSSEEEEEIEKTPVDKVNSVISVLQQLIKAYTFDLLENLDLSETVVTGSIIPATLGILLKKLILYHSQSYSNLQYGLPLINQKPYSVELELTETKIQELESEILEFYPPLYTRPTNLEKYRQLIATGQYRLRGNGLISPDGRQKIKLEDEDGADIDLAVLAETDEEFDAIANKHFRTLRKDYPEAEMNKVEKVKKYLWEISGLPRKIQIYRSSLRQILTHHLAMVRGFIYGNGSERMMYCSANCLISLYTRKSPNYYYFAGLKSPAEIILKYEQRGYQTELPGGIKLLLADYRRLEPRWQNRIWELIQEVQKSRDADRSDSKTNWRALREKLIALFFKTRYYSALLGWGNFDVAFLQTQAADFLKDNGFAYKDLNLAKLTLRFKPEENRKSKTRASRTSTPGKDSDSD